MKSTKPLTNFLERQKLNNQDRNINFSMIAGFVVFILVFIFFSIRAKGFLTQVNILRNLIMPASISAVIAMGMTIVMSAGGIDLSVSSIAGLAGLAAAASAALFKFPLPLMFFAALVTGGLIGAINGSLVAYGGISPFVVTLSVVFLARGIQYLIVLTTVVTGTYRMHPMSVSRLGGNPFFLIVTCAVVIFILYFFLDHTIFGRNIKATGLNLEAAKFSGIPVRWYTWLTYVICGFCCAITGLMLTANEGMARVGSGESYLIDAFLLPILGSSVFGRFSIQGTVFSSLFLYMIINGLFILGASPESVRIIKGGLLLAIILVSGIQKRIQEGS